MKLDVDVVHTDAQMAMVLVECDKIHDCHACRCVGVDCVLGRTTKLGDYMRVRGWWSFGQPFARDQPYRQRTEVSAGPSDGDAEISMSVYLRAWAMEILWSYALLAATTV